MIEILSGKTGTLHMVFGWMLTLYPLLTLPALLGFFYETREQEAEDYFEPIHERARISLEPSEVPGSHQGLAMKPSSEAPSVPVAEATTASFEHAALFSPLPSSSLTEEKAPAIDGQAKPEKGAPAFTLEQLLNVLNQASLVEEKKPLAPLSSNPSSTQISMAELEALTAPRTSSDITSIEEARSVKGGSTPFEFTGSSSQQRAKAYLQYRTSIKPASERRTLSQARRVAENPRMKPWVRQAAEQLLARTGTDG